ncbi:hypothetical protein [Mesobacillus maritimus]|uniref:Uncharacterized protein n=1 Tax=Mesobacillus maritimus TaxID=1643336 RepID=A0ABS7K2B5_9BACI|nr:hypothetical protein [Mesobacillus maritimus]MBY0096385.1 hypothetical protein [Mesobacillus maritimus]
MHFAYGVEATPLISDIQEFVPLLTSNLKLIEAVDSFYIYEDEHDAINVMSLLKEAELFETLHPLIVLDNGSTGECFFDNGFKGQTWTYLYKDILTAFLLTGKCEQLEMAKIQVDEQLVYKTSMEGSEVFFVEKQFSTLVEGIAAAYNCKLSFLDLDKC